MATINIANNTWQTQRQTSTIRITTSSTNVKFYMGDDNTEEMCCAKACIAINADNYSTIQLQYDSVESNGDSSLRFGVFDNMVAEYYWESEYDNDISSSSLSGVGVIEITSNSKKIITIDISNVTGTKYVGFLFYGNTYSVGHYGSVEQNITITSLTATVASHTITYYANGGSGTTSSQTVTAGNAITLRSNSFTAPPSKKWTLTLDGNGGKNGSPTFKDNYFYKWREGSTSGTAYSAGDSYTPKTDTKMYAWWGTNYIWGTTTRDSDISEGYTVTFDANGGTCDTPSSASVITTSWNFSGWGNSAKNPTSTFKSNTVYGQTSDYTAYAIWSPITTNGSITLPTPTRNGYAFLGWSTSEFDTSGITGEYTPTDDITLYAIWKRMGNVYIYDGVEFSPYQVFIYDDSGWNQYVPYIRTESGWELYSG